VGLAASSPFRGPSVKGSISGIPCSVRIFCRDDDDNCALMHRFCRTVGVFIDVRREVGVMRALTAARIC
jgi:hypothetical protein